MAKKTKQQGKTEQAGQKPGDTNGATVGATAAGTDMDAIALLSADHRKVEELFAKFQSAASDAEKQQIAKQVCGELAVHTQLEEEIFYPACIQAAVETESMDEAQVEHDGAKVLIADILANSESGKYFEAKMTVLSDYIKHHVGEEEKADGIFAKAKESNVDLQSIGRQLSTRKEQISAKGQEAGLHPQFKSFDLPNQQETGMSRQFNDQERDEQGRFESQDRERSSNRGRGRNEFSSRNDYDEDRSHSGSSRDSSGYHRDDRNESPGYSGSSRQEDDERGGYMGGRDMGGRDMGGREMGGRDRYDDDDNHRSNAGRGSGWYGDSEGQSRMSQQGWEDRDDRSRSGGSNRNERYDDEGNSSSGSSTQGRYSDDDNYGEGRGRSQQGGSYGNDRDDDYRQSRGQSRGQYGAQSRAGRQQGSGSLSRSQHTQGSGDRGSHRSSSASRSGGSHNSSGSHDSGGSHNGGSRHSSGEGRGWHGDSAGHSAAARQRNR